MRAGIERSILEQYAATHARLASNPEYQHLKSEAHREAEQTPHSYIQRNRLALYVEIHTPLV